MSSHETLIQNNAILDAINRINDRIDGLRQEIIERFNNVEARLRRVENEVTEVKNLQLSFDVRIDRIEAMAHDALNVAYNVRADVKVLRAEVAAWAADVAILQERAA